MDNKKIAVVLLVIIALGLVYQFYFSEEPVADDGENPPLTAEEVFLTNLQESDHVYIVMDLRDVPDSNISDGVMQCGVDFAGSSGIADKNITTIALTEDECIGLENKTVEECLELVEQGPTLYITTGAEQEYFENKLVVSIDEPYEYGSCGISAVEVAE